MTKRSNKQVVIGRSNLNYKETHRQFTTYVANAARDIKEGRAYAEFLQRGNTTKLSIRARVSGERCVDADEAYLWLLDLTSRLAMGRDCGKLSITPNGNSSEIVVSK